jgi:dTDP-4-dehydrorhamnose reductase
MPLRLLITGSAGQLAVEIRRCLETLQAEIGPIPCEYKNAQVDYVDHRTLDISDACAVDAWFAERKYDAVINCAAVTNVDGCELNPVAAYAVNAIGAENVARAAARQATKIVQVSTDYVFAGLEPGERTEVDVVAPKSAYGRTKLAGEQLVAVANRRHFIVRTAWLYGYTGKNFVKTMRSLGASHERITVVADQWGNPTNANDVAYEILALLLTNNYGVYHVTNKGTCSWADFAATIMCQSKLDCEVVPITSEEYKAKNPLSANRPKYSSLRNAHLENSIGDAMRPWEDALVSYLCNLPKLEG